jgi:uncharacterized membrane protein YhaH (DUF805 family)
MMDWMLLPYRRYFAFDGRSRRREYWLFWLFYVLVSFGISVVFGRPQVVGNGLWFSYVSTLNVTGSLVGNLFWLVSFVPGLAVAVRRLHDVDRSGMWLLLMFVPFVGWFTLLIFMCLDGTPGGNRFGADPKARGVVEVFR